MNVVFAKWNSYGNNDIEEAFQSLNINVCNWGFDNHGELHHDVDIESDLKKFCLDNEADFVFSFNYYPIIARACYSGGIKYVSWVYDNPQSLIFSYTVTFPTNFVFIFDKSQFLEFYNNGITTVHYLPLAVNTKRIERMFNSEKLCREFRDSKWYNKGPIAFVGSMYNDEHQFYDRLKGISQKTRGYLEGIMEAQKHIYGYNMVQDLLTDEIIEEMYKFLPMNTDPDGVETQRYLFGEYVINRKLTAIERKEYIEFIASCKELDYEYVLDIYTRDEKMVFPRSCNHGKIDYYDTTPFVYNNAKINFNITLRSIHTGIPLRAFDILGAGGFLLSNYQDDFIDCFVDGEDYVSFDSREDLLDKTKYFLKNDDERKEIAANGLYKCKMFHTYEDRIKEMLSYIS